MRIAYFTNQYPAVSHTFIRREIRALEGLGMNIHRYALRSGENLVDPDDLEEEKRSHYILKRPTALILGLVRGIFVQPVGLARAIGEAVRVGWRSDRGLVRHLVYVAEASVLAVWCSRDGIEHVHVHFGTNATTVAMLAQYLSKVPYSFTAHGPFEFERATLLSLDKKLRRASFAICVSSYGRSQLMRWTSLDDWHKIHVVHCGVDAKFLEHAYESPPEIASFVCVGRLVPQKAQLLLVRAAATLRNRGYEFRIVLAGDGPMRGQIQAEINQAGLQERVEIIGWVSGDRVLAEMVGSRALISASFAENLPVVIMEAMALGRPVIATCIAGIPELVIESETGWLVPAGDETAIVDAMREAIETSADRLEIMGASARSRVKRQHDVRHEAEKLRALFEKHDGKLRLRTARKMVSIS